MVSEVEPEFAYVELTLTLCAYRKEPTMNEHVYWILELKIKPGELDNFKVLMMEMIEATQANEPGTLNYEWTINENNTSCHIYERYIDSTATMVHLGNFGANFADRFMTCLEPTRFYVYGQPNDEVKEALSGFGAVFMAPIGGFTR